MKGAKTVENTGDLDADENNKNKNVIFRNSRAAKILSWKILDGMPWMSTSICMKDFFVYHSHC